MARPDLRLIVITDAALAAPRTVAWVVGEALAAGAPAIQLRDKSAGAAQLLEQALALRELTARFEATLFINDRFDVACAAQADGAHLGPDDVPVQAARRAAPSLLLGFSTDDPDQARQAEREGADYIGCGAVFLTTSKGGLHNERIGPAGLRRITQAVQLPVIAIGGITPDNVERLKDTGVAGCAVIGAVMAAAHPGRAVQQLLQFFG
jgi:thiamine-phosphate pyrophosphorylase